jgi:2-polyprenyl-6-methoxyphenol hydroxylase-like FAD-dependent oxidoreductase
MSAEPRWDVIVIGAGPVGLLAANLLGQGGIRTLVLERDEMPQPGSRAVGVMPPSLEILEQVGLADRIISRGAVVDTAHVHGYRRYLGKVGFNRIGGAFPFVLAVPQDRTESELLKGLERFPTVTLSRGTEAVSAEQSDTGVLAVTGDGSRLAARFLLACDGNASSIRKAVELRYRERRFKDTFLMGDFKDRTDFGRDAHLFFTPLGAVESFPLADGIRRWIIQTDTFQKHPPRALIEKTVEERAGIVLNPSDAVWHSPFGIRRQIVSPYYKGRIIFAGDAAHVMPPIGGQGMNTGFADAWMATTFLKRVVAEGCPFEPLFDAYSRCRRMAAKAATSRAVLSMRIGTTRGSISSAVRNTLIWTLLKTKLTDWLATRFAMRTIPFGTIDKMAPSE